MASIFLWKRTVVITLVLASINTLSDNTFSVRTFVRTSLVRTNSSDFALAKLKIYNYS
ncbi:hypothetical protein [Gilliamella apicola]|uniref:hypothetical protein n=1 Tax=Gilliamella apicola TaxID=1196095 RepID=UPI001475DCD0|nr:hypothetical protein [Gilliamella apicola]